MLSAREIRKSYGGVVALAGVDLEVAPGEIVALLGPNGAGKTTFASIVAGLRPPDGGSVRIAGVDALRHPYAAREQLGFVPQELGVYPPLSVRDNLRLFGGLAGLDRRTTERRAAEVGALLGLEPMMDRPVRILSGGQKRRVHTAAAMLHRPAVLLLDEPTAGLDVEGRNQLLQTVRGLAAAGTAVCYSTHYLHEVEALGASVAILDGGRIIARGSLPALIAAHGTSAVELAFDGPAPAVRGALAVPPSGLRIAAEDPAQALAQALAALGADAGRLRSVQVLRPSLDTVYLTLTGRDYAAGEREP